MSKMRGRFVGWERNGIKGMETKNLREYEP